MEDPGKELTLQELLSQNLNKEEPSTEEGSDKAKEIKKPSEEDKEINLDAIFEASHEKDDSEEDDKKPDEDEKDKEKSKDSPDSKKETHKDTEDDDIPFTLAFARYQLEQGNLTSLDEEELKKVIEDEGEEAAMAYIQNKEAETIRNELLDTYEEDVKYYLDLLDSGVDRDDAKGITQAKFKYSKISEDDVEKEDQEDLRKEVMKTYYKLTTKFSDAKIDKEIESKISLGEDIEFAKEALPEIKDHFDKIGEERKKEIQKQEEDIRKSQADKQKELEEKIDKLDEIIPKHTLSKAEKKKIKEKLIKPVKEVNGVPLNAIWAKRMEDPFKFDSIIAALDNYGVFDGNWDKLISQNKTKAAEDLRKAIHSNSSFKTRTDKLKASQTGEDESMESIEAMKKAFNL